MFYFSEINYLALLASSVAHMILGMLWYSPALFGKAWAGMMGFNFEDKAAWKQKQKSNTTAYIASFIGGFLTAFVLALLFQAALITTISEGIIIVSLAWIGFTGPMMLNNTLFGEKPIKLWAIDSLYYLVSAIIMSIILIAWI